MHHGILISDIQPYPSIVEASVHLLLWLDDDACLTVCFFLRAVGSVVAPEVSAKLGRADEGTIHIVPFKFMISFL